MTIEGRSAAAALPTSAAAADAKVKVLIMLVYELQYGGVALGGIELDEDAVQRLIAGMKLEIRD